MLFIILLSINYISIIHDNKETYSRYNLVFNTHAPVISANKLGLINTMIIDINKALFHFKEKSITINNINQDNTLIDGDYNTLEIDFDTLIDNEKDTEIKMLHQYFKNSIGTKKNNYTGMFKNKNVIFILAESLDPIAIDKNLTPTLYKLANNGFNFTNYYSPLYPYSTADGEFRAEWSLISSHGDIYTLYAYKDTYSPFIFANSFNEYNINIYHNYDGDFYKRNDYFKGLGYNNFKSCNNGLKMTCNSFNESDKEMVEVSIDDYLYSDKPFFTYYITLSAHCPYTLNKVNKKYWQQVKNLPYSNKIKYYLASNIDLDKALELLIDKLANVNKLDDTVIIISPDHYPYGLTNEEINEKADFNRNDPFELYHSDFIIWNSLMDEPVQIDKVGSQLDILPTILNLFGKKYDSRLLMGQDMLSDNEGLVALANRSFITDSMKYNAITNEYFANNTISNEVIEQYNLYIDNLFKVSDLILKKDYYRLLFIKK